MKSNYNLRDHRRFTLSGEKRDIPEAVSPIDKTEAAKSHSKAKKSALVSFALLSIFILIKIIGIIVLVSLIILIFIVWIFFSEFILSPKSRR
jgi:uncharacterized membrane protein